MNVKPTKDRIVVKPLEPEKVSKGGIIIPDTAQTDSTKTGEIIAIGSGRVTEQGVVIPFEVKVGDRILFKEHAGHAVKVDSENYRVLTEQDIIVVFEE